MPDGVLVFRAPQVLWVVAATELIVAARHIGSEPGLAVVYLVLAACTAAGMSAERTEADDAGVTIVRFWRGRHIPWRDVVELRTGRFAVQVVTVSGAAPRAPYVVTRGTVLTGGATAYDLAERARAAGYDVPVRTRRSS